MRAIRRSTVLLLAAACSSASQPDSPSPLLDDPPALRDAPAVPDAAERARSSGSDGVVRLHPRTTTSNLYGLTGDASGGLVAVGSRGAILTSHDRGANWHEVNSGTTRELFAAWHGADESTWAVGEAGTILRSRDGGRRWRARTSGTMATLHHVVGNASELWAAGAEGTILRSSDAGETWAAVAMPSLPEPPAARQPDPPPMRRREREESDRRPAEPPSLRSLMSDREDVLGLGSTKPGELWVLLRKLLWRTTDGGASWSLVIRLSPPHDTLAHLWVGGGDDPHFGVSGRNEHGTTPDVFVGVGRGDGSARIRWTELQTRLISPPVIAGAGKFVVLAGDGYAVHASNDGGATFSGSEASVSMQSPYSLAKRALWIAPDGVVFAAGSHGALMRSSDRGEHWELLVDGAREPLFGGALSPDGEATYGAVAHAVLRVDAKGSQLLSLPMEMPIGGGATTTVPRGLARCCTDVWVAPDGAIVAAGEGGVWRSDDDGAAWVTTYDDPRWDCCGTLWGDTTAVHGVGRDVVLTSTDRGKHWSKRSIAALVGDDVTDRLDIAGHGDVLYVIGGKGVILRSENRGKTWAREKSGTTQYLYAAFVGPSRTGELAAWAVGHEGIVLRSLAGGPWTTIDPTVRTPLLGVWGDPSRGELWLAGDAGLLRSPDEGATWTAVAPEHRSMRSIFGDGLGRVLAFGDEGVVLSVAAPP